MGTITFTISDKEENRLRRLVEKYKGKTKEDFDHAVNEALKIWINEKEQEKIAERIRERMSKGLYKLPKDWKFNRDEIYNRG